MPGRTLGIVGESGSGKTMLSRAILGLLPRHARLDGRVRFDGADLTRLEPGALRKVRGRSLAVVFQDPMTSLNPVLTIGLQIIETLQEHLGMTGAAARKRAAELLAAVGIAEPEQRLRQYPHQLSGGMCQRAVIAMALSCEPKLLIADEPTTALDVTIQAQILDLLAREQRRRRMAMILITHDLGVLAGRTDEVAAMYAGRVVERAPTPLLFAHMRMPYTQALLAAIPRPDPSHSRLRVRAALPICGGPLPSRGAAALRPATRSSLCLLAAAAGATDLCVMRNPVSLVSARLDRQSAQDGASGKAAWLRGASAQADQQILEARSDGNESRQYGLSEPQTRFPSPLVGEGKSATGKAQCFIVSGNEN